MWGLNMPKLRTDISIEQIVYLYYTQKMSAYDIAEHLNCCHDTVYYRLKKAGYKIRRGSEANSLAMWKHWQQSCSKHKITYNTHYRCPKHNWRLKIEADHSKTGMPLCPHCSVGQRELRTTPRGTKHNYKHIYPHGPTKPEWAK